MKLQRNYDVVCINTFNQLYITNKKGTIVGMPSSSKTLKRRLVYSVAVIILELSTTY